MSWIPGYFHKPKSYTSSLVADLSPATDEDEIVKRCGCGRNVIAKISGLFNSAAIPIFVLVRSAADYALRSSPDVTSIRFSNYTYHFTRNPTIARAILEWHRSDCHEETGPNEDGRFAHTLIAKGMVRVANKIFCPQTPIKSSDSVMSCEKKDHHLYSKLLNYFFNQRSIQSHLIDIEEIIAQHLTQFELEQNEFPINAKIKSLATSVMAKVFLGINDPLDDICLVTGNIIPWISEEVTREFSSVYDFLANYIPQLHFVSNDDKVRSQKILSEAVGKAIKDVRGGQSRVNSIVGKMVEEKFTNRQIKSMILLLFAAGEDNMSTSILYVIFKIAQNPELQEAIRKENATPLNSECIEALLCEGLRMFCPISGISRVAAQNLVLSISKTNSEALISKTFIKKGDAICPMTYLIAKDPSIYPNPEKFDPSRFDGKAFLANLKHKPFGNGPHMCPGWYLYYVVAKLTIHKLVMGYDVTTSIKKEPRPKVGIVVGIADEITIKVDKRHSTFSRKNATVLDD